ncbi:MAG: ferrochelatase [Candidatus Viridilinea halotolerans]|uniref:Ferrochelatase n=1 Tax=Candidatus Viridilinea halotolerans TaxID=2491704 RepID=A0A426U999_9CHLR|nr:MAG: ferrochelatase [Candidatus Viridilinea halotolerans]
MLNLGGPKNLDEVGPFLLRLFADREIIQLPAQRWLGPFIARRRTPQVQEHYRMIGGGSPLLHWTTLQGEGMVRWLDRISPATAPHRAYVAFRYAPPFSDDALRQMQADGVRRAVAFTQYPQFSCATTGSSLNELWRAARRIGLERAFTWSVLDRWPTHPGFIAALAHSIELALEKIPATERAQTLLLFSAHALPLAIINRGDPYPHEIAASMHAVMAHLGYRHEFMLSYQSDVGPVRWIGPSIAQVIPQLAAQGRRSIVVVPLAFTSDHIETLGEIDHEYAELAHKVGIRHFVRAPALNDDPAFLQALAELVRDHLEREAVCSTQYRLRCPGCTNAQCRQVVNPVAAGVGALAHHV